MWPPCCCSSLEYGGGKGLSVSGVAQEPAPDSLSLPSTTSVCSPEYSMSAPSRSRGAAWCGPTSL